MRRASAYDFAPANAGKTNYAEPMTPAIADTAAPLTGNEEILSDSERTEKTLEEEFVNTLAPIGHSETPKYDDDKVKPVSSNVGNASLF